MRTLVLLLLLPCISIAQTWAPVGAKWTYTQGTINPHYTSYTTFESVADTIISGQNCRRLTKIERLGPITRDTAQLYMYSDSNEIYFRKDSTWCLLYDFNAQAGDSFRLDCFLKSDGQPIVVHVLSVDTVSINGHRRKLYNYLATDIVVEFTGYTIEGIGLTTDMFPTYENDQRGPLRCYEDHDLGLYKNEYYSSAAWNQDCEKIITDIQEQTINENIKVFPNPFREQISFEASSEVQIELIIHDVFAREVLQESLINSMTINTTPFTAGLYFYELRNDKGRIKSGIIIKH